MNHFYAILVSVAGRMLSTITARMFSDDRRMLEVFIRDTAAENVHSNLLAALLAAEDHRFFSHPGVDCVAVCRAIWMTLFRGQIQGGSTIEQQLVRLVTGDCRRALRRKVKEAILALELSRSLPKTDIAAIYLARAYFGAGSIGVVKAAEHLGFDLNEVTLWQAAELTARLRYPPGGRSTPRQGELLMRRRDYILRRISQHETVWAEQIASLGLGEFRGSDTPG